jgi:hypothetical protein
VNSFPAVTLPAVGLWPSLKSRKKIVKKIEKSSVNRSPLLRSFGPSLIFIHLPELLRTLLIQNGHRQTQLLSIRRVHEHSSGDIVESVYQVIRKYQIQGLVGFLVLDNTSSNDVAVDCILRMLDSSDAQGCSKAAPDPMLGPYYQSRDQGLLTRRKGRKSGG